MAITSWPYVAQDTTDIEYSRLYREAVDDGVIGSFGDTNLKVTGDSTGMQVKMAVGAAVARGYEMYSTAIEVIPIGAAHATLARIDRVVLELNLSAPTVPQRLVPKVVPGTAGSGTPTALTQTDTGIFQIPMARVNVAAAASTISAAAVTDDRDWVGNTVKAWVSNSKRPAAPRKYALGFNESLGAFEYHNGTTWVSINDHVIDLSTAAVTGTLPITRGGTGATTKAGIRAAIGLAVQLAAPSSPAVDDLWVKKSS